MAEVFISYSSLDSAKAKEILERLEGTGISCWLSQRDIPPGADYAMEIPKAITACSYFVLLLTNAAQNSPYVMLELDQAFKQKKEIIPILLEQVVENEKTNFFLNAKQKLDATKNLTSAVNEVIRRIRPNISQPQIVIENVSQNRQKQNEQVCCPYCGCTVLKRKRLFVDRYLYPEEGRKENDDFPMWLIDNRNDINTTVALSLSMIGLFVIMILLVVIKDKGWIHWILLLILGAIYAVAATGADKIGKAADVTGELVCAINDSGLKYWTFRCAGCEKHFSILLPAKGKLKDYAPDLLEETTKQ